MYRQSFPTCISALPFPLFSPLFITLPLVFKKLPAYFRRGTPRQQIAPLCSTLMPKECRQRQLCMFISNKHHLHRVRLRNVMLEFRQELLASVLSVFHTIQKRMEGALVRFAKQITSIRQKLFEILLNIAPRCLLKVTLYSQIMAAVWAVFTIKVGCIHLRAIELINGIVTEDHALELIKLPTNHLNNLLHLGRRCNGISGCNRWYDPSSLILTVKIGEIFMFVARCLSNHEIVGS